MKCAKPGPNENESPRVEGQSFLTVTPSDCQQPRPNKKKLSTTHKINLSRFKFDESQRQWLRVCETFRPNQKTLSMTHKKNLSRFKFDESRREHGRVSGQPRVIVNFCSHFATPYLGFLACTVNALACKWVQSNTQMVTVSLCLSF